MKKNQNVVLLKGKNNIINHKISEEENHIWNQIFLFYREHENVLCILMGVLIISFAMLPYLILKTNAIISYHDQLDGEVLGYMYQAKYLFSGFDYIPEFMNGASKTALTPPAILEVLFYKVLPAFWAFVVIQWLVMLSGFLGMYLYLYKTIKKGMFSLFVGILFAFLPLNSVYGLGMFGIPLLIISFWNLYEGVHRKKSFGMIVLFGLMSSLVLVGFACVAISIFTLCLLLFKEKKQKNIEHQRGIVNFAMGALLLIEIYAVTNINLILQLFGKGTTEETHKSEILLEPVSFLESFKNIMLNGSQHVTDYRKYILCFICFTLLFCLILRKKINTEIKEKVRILWLLVCFNIGIGLAVAIWNCELIVTIRKGIGGFAIYFQADRIYWLMPAIWYMSLGISIWIIWELSGTNKYSSRIIKIVVLGIACFIGVVVADGSQLKWNLQVLRNPEYKAISWADFYAEDIYTQIKDYIDEPIDEYKVVSLGIYPAAALYNGFYCLDGYSNNYSLDYKHEFREIIAPEIEKSDYLKELFDEWGNRCYVLSSEIPGYFSVEKGGFYFQNLSINCNKLKEMGCNYLFSAAYIQNAQEIGLKLLREEPFETKTSYYKIYVYQLK